MVDETIAFLRRRAVLVAPAELPRDVRADPDDLPVLGTAMAGDADVLVTGDGDLLALGRIGDIPIVSPRTFFDRLA